MAEIVHIDASAVIINAGDDRNDITKSVSAVYPLHVEPITGMFGLL